MAEAGLPPSTLLERQTAQTPDGRGRPRLRQVLEELLRLPPDQRPTALVCSHDDLALHALRLLHDMGLSVPGDMAVTGFDDLPYAAWSQPPLTTVAQDGRAMGERAVQQLWELLHNPHAGSGRELLPVALHLRASTLGSVAGYAPAPGSAASLGSPPAEAVGQGSGAAGGG